MKTSKIQTLLIPIYMRSTTAFACIVLLAMVSTTEARRVGQSQDQPLQRRAGAGLLRAAAGGELQQCRKVTNKGGKEKMLAMGGVWRPSTSRGSRMSDTPLFEPPRKQENSHAAHYDLVDHEAADMAAAMAAPCVM